MQGLKLFQMPKSEIPLQKSAEYVLEALPGFKPSVPVVFCGLFPIDAADFSDLRDALEKLSLNDSSFSFEAETSAALGFGFRCGFLGLLHMEVIRERLAREFNLELISNSAICGLSASYDRRRDHHDA